MTVDDLRVGSGFDVHPFSADPTRALVLGGVTIAGARGLVGHSDADVIAHACAEALLGAAGMGDLGTWFPDDDPTYSGADSVQLLRTVASELRSRGWSAINIDCSVVCEAPKLAPHRNEMQRRLFADAEAFRELGMAAITLLLSVCCTDTLWTSTVGD